MLSGRAAKKVMNASARHRLARIFHKQLEKPTMRRVGARGLQVATALSLQAGSPDPAYGV